VASAERLRFGVLGTGSIAAEFVDALALSRSCAASQIVLARAGSEPEAIDVPGGENIVALEADGVAALLRDGVDACRPTWDDTLANMRTLDRWRAAVGAA
jgi:hypothetical protein